MSDNNIPECWVSMKDVCTHLDTSNLKTWDATPVDEEDLFTLYERINGMIDTVKRDRRDLDMVYEVMLKMGVPLTFPVIPVEVDSYNSALFFAHFHFPVGLIRLYSVSSPFCHSSIDTISGE